MRKKRTLVDVDGVLADLVGGVCQYLALYGIAKTAKDVTNYDFAKCFSRDENVLIEKAMGADGFCLGLNWYPGAKRFLDQLKEIGDVVIVTKPHRASRTWVHDRNHWLDGRAEKIVHTSHKEVISGDFLVEDSGDNLTRWMREHPRANGFLIDRPWNQGPLETAAFRVYQYDSIVNLIDSMEID